MEMPWIPCDQNQMLTDMLSVIVVMPDDQILNKISPHST